MKIKHWNYDDGYHVVPEILRKNRTEEVEFDAFLVGWHCWAYPGDSEDIWGWLEDNMIGNYTCDFRFNGGDCMCTVHIVKDEDATLFKLRWM